jgi:membrane protease YdiL (CAAX protease family)
VEKVMGWDEQESAMEDKLLEDSDEQPGRAEIIVLSVFFEGGLAPLALFLGWLLSHPALGSFTWNGRDAAWGIVASVPLILMFLAIMQWPIGPLSGVRKFWDTEVAPLLADSSWSEIALISLSKGVGEEMLIRGVIQASFVSWCGASWGLTLTSILFGLLHPISIPYVVIACIIGFYLGTVFMVSGNLLTVMVVHAFYDFVTNAYLLRLRPAV